MPMEKTFEAATAEAEISARWDAAGAFRAGANARPGAEPFVVLLPPPNVTGSLHIGHAFNATLQDILVRWHRMRGHDTLWQPGQDHAGIATQMVVERELATSNRRRTDMTRDEFTDLVWTQKERSGGTIIDQLKRLGASCDWSRNAFTMSGAPGDTRAGHENSPDFHDAVLKVFVDWYHKGLIFRGKRLVNWDPHFETAISDLEVENLEVDGHMWHFKYPLEGGETYEYVERGEDGAVTFRETRDYIAIATTRPETMLGDGAVAVHPSDTRYAPIVGKRVLLPLADRYIPIIADEYPDPAFGSGAVKITGAHDFNDNKVAERHGLPMYRLMDTKGQMRTDGIEFPPDLLPKFWIDIGAEDDDFNPVPVIYRGMDRFKAREAVVEDLETLGLMIAVEDKKIVQPRGDRSKVVIEPMRTDQWFVDTKRLAGPALEAVRSGKTRILPDRDEKTYFHWLENIEPWCISRQLWWGHQIPVWYDIEAGMTVCAPSEEEAYAQAIAEANRVGYDQNIVLTRDPDVLDTWFSSGIWPIGTMGWPEETPEMARYYPSSVLVTGFDIIFFWVARMMMMQKEITGRAPFHTVYVHALVRDAVGKKMSKSLGNVIDPLELIDAYGADALRFTLAAMAGIGRDLRLSVERVAGYRNFGTKLWNAARFAEMNGCVPVPGFDPAQVTLTANRWIVGETGRLRETLDAALDAYRFNDAAAALYAHVWGRVCDWYVELAKPLFSDAAAASETRATMAWVLEQCLILMHPFMPFVTEALWGQTRGRESLLAHAKWPGYGAKLVDAAAAAEMGWVIALIEAIRSVRAETHVPAGARVTLVALEMSAAQAESLDTNRALVSRLARDERFETAAAAPKGAVAFAIEGASFCLPLADVIDIAAERARLAKALDKLARETGGLRAKLGNAAFVAKAPEAVVDANRTRLEAAEEEATILAAAQTRLAALE